MIDLGTFQKLPIANIVSFGAYLDAGTGNPGDNILLPRKQIPQGARPGDAINVFLYRDSTDRLIATTQQPLAKIGELAYLKVVQNTTIGAFLDWGLEKDLFLPFSEQKYGVQEGKYYLVAVYLDKKARLCATTDIAEYLRTDSPYQKNDVVKGTAYIVKREFGVLVAVDNCYAGLIPENEYFQPIQVGDQLTLRVIRVREDGRLDLSTRQLAHKQMKDDATMLLEILKMNGGFLPLNDKSHPRAIKHHLQMSKKAFKRAVGQLLKAQKIEQTARGLRLL